MKKICVLIIMLLVVTGCGGSSLNNLDINKASDAVEETLDDMVNIEGETLEDVYGVSLSTIEEFIVKQNGDGDMYAIIKAKDKAKVKEDMDGYFDKIKTYNEAYEPDRLETLENRLEKEIGDYLIYIVSEDAKDIYEDILDTIE